MRMKVDRFHEVICNLSKLDKRETKTLNMMRKFSCGCKKSVNPLLENKRKK
jgi:hypothetical protein